MDFRNMIANPKSGGAIAAVVLVLAITISLTTGGEPGRPSITGCYFYDLNTGRIFDGPAVAKGPVDAPSGPLNDNAAAPDAGGQAGMRAHIFSCGACDPSEWFVGWIEYTPNIKPKDPTNPESVREAAERGFDARQVRAVDGEKWLTASTAQGAGLLEAAQSKCGAGKNIECFITR